MNKFIITMLALIASTMQLQAMDNETVAKSFSPNGTITYSYKNLAAIKNQNCYLLYLIHENTYIYGREAQEVFYNLEFQFKQKQRQSKKRLDELSDITLLSK